MSLKNSRYFLYILSILFISSCVSTDKIIYFQEMEEGIPENDTMINYEPTLGVGDLITINVSAMDPLSAVPFNLLESTGGNVAGTAKVIPYLVDSAGEINFPVLGKLKVEGLTNKQITDSLVQKLDKYIVDPVVNIRLSNFKITVLGDVKNPGTFTIENERVSIIQALGLAGDLTIQGKRSTVKLIREKGAKKMVIPIDMTSESLFNSPYYYLAQNDVLYVEPNKTRVNSSAVGPNTAVIFSALATLISIIAILLN